LAPKLPPTQGPPGDLLVALASCRSPHIARRSRNFGGRWPFSTPVHAEASWTWNPSSSLRLPPASPVGHRAARSACASLAARSVVACSSRRGTERGTTGGGPEASAEGAPHRRRSATASAGGTGNHRPSSKRPARPFHQLSQWHRPHHFRRVRSQRGWIGNPGGHPGAVQEADPRMRVRAVESE
jgi:hypothetical protein